MENIISKTSLRSKADKIKEGRCKYLIAVLEEPSDPKNIGTVIRNINALGVEKLYIVNSRAEILVNWESIRESKSLLKTSVSLLSSSRLWTSFTVKSWLLFCFEY